MITHRWIAAALCASLLFLARHAAAAEDEIVVYGKRSDAVALDRAAARVDVESERRALSVKLERALAADPKLKAERVASAPAHPRG